MRQISLLILLVTLAWQTAVAQVASFDERPLTLCSQRIYRTEFSPFDTRQEALSGNHTSTAEHIPFVPTYHNTVGQLEFFGQQIEIPTAWIDNNTYLHVENAQSAYSVAIGDTMIGSAEEGSTPADYLLSPYLKQGNNRIMIILRPSRTAELNADSPTSSRAKLEGCYITSQRRLSIFDYDVRITPDEKGETLRLALDIIATNDFNGSETIAIGYDIYDPSGKLVDYAVREITLEGRSRDTLRVRTSLGAEMRYLWQSGKASLYRLMLYTKRNGKPREYIPLRVGAGTTTFADGKILRNGKPIQIKSVRYNALKGRKEAIAEITALRKQGYNTLLPDAPQPKWFYDVCDGLGVYVVEQCAISPATLNDDRRVGGTPSNNPLLADEYIDRVRAAYYRTRNHSCIIAYSLGSAKAGNGYCMYKAYEWLKTVERERAVVCLSADGEWNTDLDKIE